MRPKPSPHPEPASRDLIPLWVSALFATTVFLLVPAHVYVLNQSALAAFASDFYVVAGLLALAATLAVSALLTLVPSAARIRLSMLLLGVCFLLWIHAYVVVWSYEAMDGAPIPWGTYGRRLLIDATLWCVVLLAAFRFAPRFYQRAPLACGALAVIQLASLGISAHRVPSSPASFSKFYYVDRRELFDFSSGRNVIVILLDEFQTDIFAEAVLPHEEYRGNFAGFTYFPDTVAAANFTEIALPAILTGEMYDNRRPRADYLREAYLSDSLPAVLMRKGWTVDLYPWRGLANEALYYDESIATNFRRRPQPLADRLLDTARVLDLGLFRSAPQFAKPYVYRNATWWFSRLAGAESVMQWAHRVEGTPPTLNPRFEHPTGYVIDDLFVQVARGLDNPGTNFSRREGPNRFKFYHLGGLHVPVKMRRDLTTGSFDYNRANFSEQAEAYARIVGAFLKRLREIGAYDNSMIVILGDHGSGRTKDLHVNPGDPARTKELDRTAVRNDFQRDKARGLPLLLVKRFSETGELKVSRAPASLLDVSATIRAALRLDSPDRPPLAGIDGFRGQPLYSLSEDQPRARYYGALRWAPEPSAYVNPISLYRVERDGWSDDSWSFVKTLAPP